MLKKPLGHSADFVCQTWSQVLFLADLAKSNFICKLSQSLGYPRLMKVFHIHVQWNLNPRNFSFQQEPTSNAWFYSDLHALFLQLRSPEIFITSQLRPLI